MTNVYLALAIVSGVLCCFFAELFWQVAFGGRDFEDVKRQEERKRRERGEGW